LCLVTHSPLLTDLYTPSLHAALPIFFRHAAADHAGATDAIFLRQHHARAIAGRDARGAHATRAAANDEKIGVELGHVGAWCGARSEEHTSELQSHLNLVCRLLLEKKK